MQIFCTASSACALGMGNTSEVEVRKSDDETWRQESGRSGVNRDHSTAVRGKVEHEENCGNGAIRVPA